MPTQSLIDRYQQQLYQLLPPGRAFARLASSNVGKALRGLAIEFARVRERLDDAAVEVYPGDSVEILPEWEEAAGLPDGCIVGAPTVQERQEELLGRLGVDLIGQSGDNLQAIADPTPIGISHYQLFRTGIHSIGHRPIWSTPHAFAIQVSYEVTGDDPVECRLRRHMHQHTHANFIAYDPSVVDALPGVNHFFVPSEFIMVNGTIAEWTNRKSGDSFVATLPEAQTPVPFGAVGFVGVGGWNEETDTPLEMGGLNVRNDGNGDAGSLIRTGNTTLFMAINIDSYDAGLSPHILSSADGGFRVFISGGVGNRKLNVDRGDTLYQGDITTSTFILTWADDGVTGAIRINDGLTGTSVHAGAVGEVALNIGMETPAVFDSSYHGALLEVISGDYVGTPGISPVVDAITDYLIAKYSGGAGGGVIPPNTLGVANINPGTNIGQSWTMEPGGHSGTGAQGAQTIVDLDADDYLVTWSDVSGYAEPVPKTQQLTLVVGGSISFTTPVYTQLDVTGDLVIDMTGAPPGASWEIDSGLYSGSGSTTLTGVPPGSYLIVFSDVAGYLEPVPKSELRSLSPSGSSTFTTPVYTPEPTSGFAIEFT